MSEPELFTTWDNEFAWPLLSPSLRLCHHHRGGLAVESGLSGDQRVAIVECIENYIGDWACPDPYDAADFIAARVLEITRAPSDAALVEALEEAEATLALCEHPRSEDRVYGPEVDELGRRIGFGALMSSAQASWRKYLHDKGNPLGGEFVAGPSFGTVTRTLGIIRAALAAAKGQQP